MAMTQRLPLALIVTTLILSTPAQPRAGGPPRTDGGPIPPPAPRHEVSLKRSVMVPMRDGIELSTDLYFPEEAGDRLPVILVRTGYGAEHEARLGELPGAKCRVVVAEDVGDIYPRMVVYFPTTGKVKVKRLRSLHNNTIIEEETRYISTVESKPVGGDIELF